MKKKFIRPTKKIKRISNLIKNINEVFEEEDIIILVLLWELFKEVYPSLSKRERKETEKIFEKLKEETLSKFHSLDLKLRKLVEKKGLFSKKKKRKK